MPGRMKVQSIQEQMLVSERVWKRLEALLVAAASYSGIDFLLQIDWLMTIPSQPYWLYDILSFICIPLFIGVMAFILVRMSEQYAICNSLLASAVVGSLLLFEQIQVVDKLAWNHWLYYVNEFAPTMLVIFMFPAAAVICVSHGEGKISWKQHLMVIHVSLALCLATVSTIEYRWLAQANIELESTYAYSYEKYGIISRCNPPCQKIQSIP